MSITFNRIQLIKVATEALAEHDRQRLVYAKALAKFRVEHASEHRDRHHLGLRRLRDYLTAELRKGGPVSTPGRQVLGTHAVSDLFYSKPADYIVERGTSTPKGLLTPAEATETRALLKVLEAATGDVVSVNELKLLGLKNLQPVFAAAARGVSS